jgi:hypothetical protein
MKSEALNTLYVKDILNNKRHYPVKYQRSELKKIEFLSKGGASKADIYKFFFNEFAMIKIMENNYPSFPQLYFNYSSDEGNDCMVLKISPLSTMDRKSNDLTKFYKENYNDVVVGYYMNRLRYDDVGIDIRKKPNPYPNSICFMMTLDWIKLKIKKKIKNSTDDSDKKIASASVPKTVPASKSPEKEEIDKSQSTMDIRIIPPPIPPPIPKFEEKEVQLTFTEVGREFRLKDFDEKELFIFVIQLLHALHIAQIQYGFVHHDMHSGNVLTKKLSSFLLAGKDVLMYDVVKEERGHGEGKTYEVVSFGLPITDKIPFIIDYGRSRIQVPFRNAQFEKQNGLAFRMIKKIRDPDQKSIEKSLSRPITRIIFDEAIRYMGASSGIIEKTISFDVALALESAKKTSNENEKNDVPDPVIDSKGRTVAEPMFSLDMRLYGLQFISSRIKKLEPRFYMETNSKTCKMDHLRVMADPGNDFRHASKEEMLEVDRLGVTQDEDLHDDDLQRVSKEETKGNENEEDYPKDEESEDEPQIPTRLAPDDFEIKKRFRRLYLEIRRNQAFKKKKHEFTKLPEDSRPKTIKKRILDLEITAGESEKSLKSRLIKMFDSKPYSTDLMPKIKKLFARFCGGESAEKVIYSRNSKEFVNRVFELIDEKYSIRHDHAYEEVVEQDRNSPCFPYSHGKHCIFFMIMYAARIFAKKYKVAQSVDTNLLFHTLLSMTCIDELTQNYDQKSGTTSTIDPVSAFKFRMVEYDFMHQHTGHAQRYPELNSLMRFKFDKFQLDRRFGPEENFILKIIGDAVRFDDFEHNGRDTTYDSSFIVFAFLSAARVWNERTIISSFYLTKQYEEYIENVQMDSYISNINSIARLYMKPERAHYLPHKTFGELRESMMKSGAITKNGEPFRKEDIFKFFATSTYSQLNGIFAILCNLENITANYLFPMYRKAIGFTGTSNLPRGLTLNLTEFMKKYYQVLKKRKGGKGHDVTTTPTMPQFFEKNPRDVLLNSHLLKTGGITSNDPERIAYVGKFNSFTTNSNYSEKYMPISCAACKQTKSEMKEDKMEKIYVCGKMCQKVYYDSLKSQKE